MSASSRKVSVWLLIILLPTAAFLGWYNYRKWKEKGEEDHEETFAHTNPKWKFVTEEHWLVDETARDITEMLAFSASGRTGGVELETTPEKDKRESFDLHAKVNATEVNAHLEWKDFIWSPAEYAPWAKQLVSALKLTPAAPGSDDNGLLQTLTSPTPEVLHREAARISAALTKAPLDASLHEQAALVTAAFALREASGAYFDIRRELCRAAAHLAIAQTLQPQSAGVTRQMAEAALETLAERETPALELLGKLEHDTTPGVSAWIRALRARNTADWRNDAGDLTLLEELEIFVARARSVDPEFAFQWLEKRKPAPVHDWRRVILEGDFSVERGHQFAKESIGQEAASLATDWSLFFNGKLAEADLVKALNEPPARSVGKTTDGKESIQVLAWDMWSAQHQRHFCAAIHATIDFLRDKWGVSEYRDAQKFIRTNLSGLTLFPAIERELTEDRKDVPAISKKLSELLTSHPEALSPGAWGYLRESGEKTAALSIDDVQGWCQPAVPFGTTYEICSRSGCIHLPRIDDKAWWATTLRLAPYTYDVLHTKLWAQYGENPPADVTEATYAPLREYHLWALRRIADVEKGNSPKYIETLTQICAFDADRYSDLGAYYVQQKQPELAAQAYQKSFDVCPDRVHVANTCGWLVKYLEDHGEADKALAIAKMAAEVYSFSGLEIMARLQERRGQYKEAESYFEKIAERYEDQKPLAAFYTRERAKDPEYEKRAAGAERTYFPHGMKKAVLADFSGPPTSGAVLTGNSQHTAAAKLKKGDVMVALDGYRVESMAQYMYVRALGADDAPLQLIVWNGSVYREVAADPPQRRFGVDLADLKKK